jgi:hypothetical protein
VALRTDLLRQAETTLGSGVFLCRGKAAIAVDRPARNKATSFITTLFYAPDPFSINSGSALLGLAARYRPSP